MRPVLDCRAPRSNYHTHTQWCNHGAIDAEKTVQEAIQLGMQEIGFSEHAPFPDNRFGRMPFHELKNYIAELHRLRALYAPQIKVLVGLEIEYFAKDIPYYHQLYEVYGLDYLLLGQHYFQTSDRREYQKTKRLQTESQIAGYLDSLREAAQTGLFPIIAHPDYCFCCDLPYGPDTKQHLQNFFSTIASTDVFLEINANGFRKAPFASRIGIRRKYPVDLFWQYAKVYRIPAIVGSDCHHNGQLFDAAVERALNFWHVYQ